MELRRFLEERGIWAHHVNYSARSRPGARPRQGAWFLHWPGNELSVAWHALPGREGTWSLTFDDTAEHAVRGIFTIPFLLTVYVSILNCGWLLRLLGLEWEKGKPMQDWSREIGVLWFEGKLLIRPWCSPDHGPASRWRRTYVIDPADFFFGRPVYSKRVNMVVGSTVDMPEGRYPAVIILYTAEWKRPRWPFPERRQMARVEMDGGIPVPGKGDNSWDMGDDAIFSVGFPAETVMEALQKVRDNIMRNRERYASSAWTPAGGWPEHMEAYGGRH